MLGHYLTVPRCPEGEEEKLQNKPNTDLEVLIGFIKRMRMMVIMMLMKELTDGRHCEDNIRPQKNPSSKSGIYARVQGTEEYKLQYRTKGYKGSCLHAGQTAAHWQVSVLPTGTPGPPRPGLPPPTTLPCTSHMVLAFLLSELAASPL